MRIVGTAMALVLVYLVCFALFRWEHASRGARSSSQAGLRTVVMVDGLTGKLLKVFFYPALLLDVRCTGRDVLFISRIDASTQSLRYGMLDHC